MSGEPPLLADGAPLPPPLRELRDWLCAQALPLWASRGLDPVQGGFHEGLDEAARPAGPGYKRTRVLARQLYVFSHAETLGWDAGAVASDWGFEFLQQRTRLPGGGFARRLDPRGAILDPTLDLYDLAFVLLALAWRYRARREPAARELALETLEIVQKRLRHPSGLGFLNAENDYEPRQQNPHMHLLEAALAAYEAWREPLFLTVAEDIVALFQRSFFDRETGALFEFFTPDLRRRHDEAGDRVEPGHQFEWAWILRQHARLSGAAYEAEVRLLTARAEQTGVRPDTGWIRNAVDAAGAVRDDGSRIWPNAERIKAWAALAEQDGADPAPALAQAAGVLLDRHFAHPVPGLWRDAFDASGAAITPYAPASSLYHVFLAVVEALRLAPRLFRPWRPTAFLDRDGVLNADCGYPHRPEQLVVLPGAAAAVRRLNAAGYWVIVVSNQSGVARGLFSDAEVHAFNRALAQRLKADGACIDAFYFCPYHPEAVAPELRHANHPDRKPNPGMILRAMREHPVRRAGSFLIGDQDSDLRAAQAAGLPGWLLQSGEDLVGLVERALAAARSSG